MKDNRATFRTYRRLAWLATACASGLFAAGLSLVAQTAPSPAGTPTPQGGGAAGQPNVGQAAGRGAGGGADQGRGGARGGGRGDGGLQTGSGIPGGPSLDDPAYADVDFSPRPPVLPKPPAEEQALFQLQPGYRVELVLAEPHIAEPAAITFDGNGRMYVTELRSYMNDADGTDTLTPTGRVTRHEDRDNDGVYEIHTVFVDNLVFPRFATPIGKDAILTKHSNDPDVWKYTDTNGDGVADTRELFATDFGRSGNVEHQESFLTWAMDNWMYSTYNNVRLRWTPHGVLREPIGSPGGAWGVSQDNDGKVWIQSGASGLPGRYQLPLAYGEFSVPDQMDPELRLTWGAPVRIADMQPGLRQTRMPDGSLTSSTAGAGGDVFRGHRLPSDLVGDYFYGEVVARIVRRVRPEVREGVTHIRNYYQNTEFIRHTDPLFRPVDQATAPDGTMYIVDMYRGIIQESQWTRPGTYLRARIQQYQLDEVTEHGRIWRLTYDGMDRDRTQPRMLDETPAQLVAHLSHPNGWWRDTAQQLLVLSQDTSVVPALQQIVRTSENLLARFHALWTLEGLGALDATLARQMLEDDNPRMRVQAIRASETLYKEGDRSLADDYRRLVRDPSAEVIIQAMLTLNVLKTLGVEDAIAEARSASSARGVQVFGEQILEARAESAASAARFSSIEAPIMARGEAIYDELCYSCHGENGRGTPMPGGEAGATMAPSLVGSPRVLGHRDYVIKVLLHGMTGPLAGETYSQVMVPMGSNSDEWIASVASYIRNAFDNEAPFVTTGDVARVRAATRGRSQPWTTAELEATLPRPVPSVETWRATASHNPEQASRGLTLQGWNSSEPQQVGMWFTVELPEATRLTEVQFTSASSGGRGGGRGGRGAGANAQPQPPPQIGFPIAFEVRVSSDGSSWSEPVASGAGQGSDTQIAFQPVEAKFVRIVLTGSQPNAPVWSVQNLRLYRQAP